MKNFSYFQRIHYKKKNCDKNKNNFKNNQNINRPKLMLKKE